MQWLTEVAVLIGTSVVEVSIGTSPMESLCPAQERMSACFFGGSVRLNGADALRLGSVSLPSAVTVTLANFKSFGRVSINAAKQWRFVASIDFVPAPSSWQLDAMDAQEMAHLNLKLSKIALSSVAHGVVGQTSRIKYTDEGQAVRLEGPLPTCTQLRPSNWHAYVFGVTRR